MRSQKQTIITTKRILVAVGLLLLLAWHKSNSPVYVFVNDTPDRVRGSIVGNTSPSWSIDLMPEDYEIVNQPAWLGWHAGYLKASPDGRWVEPHVDLGVMKIVWIGSLPYRDDRIDYIIRQAEENELNLGEAVEHHDVFR